jgi:hypothetical protein
MNAFFQPVFENWPVLAALTGLAYAIIRLSFKTNEGLNLIRSEMREGFLKVNHHLENHNREIRRIKRKMKQTVIAIKRLQA